jgi:hypothetical protein
MKELPRLDLTYNHNKKNDYIIFPHSHSIKGNAKKSYTKKHKHTKKYITKKRTMRKSKKGFFNIFT